MLQWLLSAGARHISLNVFLSPETAASRIVQCTYIITFCRRLIRMSWTTWTTRLWLSTPTLKESVSSTYTSTTATGRSVKYTTMRVHVLVCTWMMMHSKHPLFHLPFLPPPSSSPPPSPHPSSHPHALLPIHLPFISSICPSSSSSALNLFYLPFLTSTCPPLFTSPPSVTQQ